MAPHKAMAHDILSPRAGQTGDGIPPGEEALVLSLLPSIAGADPGTRSAALRMLESVMEGYHRLSQRDGSEGELFSLFFSFPVTHRILNLES